MAVMSLPALPKQIHRYRVLSELGRGSMGRVYLARDPNIERRIALKVLMPERLGGTGEEELRRRFVLEAKAAGGLSHRGIVTIYDADTDPATGYPYLAMEWVRGCSLRTLLGKEGPLATARAVSMAAQVARALDYAHRREVVHRDIKPANLLVVGDDDRADSRQAERQTGGGQEAGKTGGGQEQRIKVVDFGIAKLVSKSFTQPGRVLGSPYYMAPEQVRGNEVDGRTDLFALGAVLYECLTGRVAFAGETVANVSHKILAVDPRPIEIYNPDVPPSLRAVVQRALEKMPQDRYRSGAELAAALETVGAELVLGHSSSTGSLFTGVATGTAPVVPESVAGYLPNTRNEMSAARARADLPAGTELRGQVPGADLDRWRWPRALLLAAVVLIAVVLVDRSIDSRVLVIADHGNATGFDSAVDPEAAAALADGYGVVEPMQGAGAAPAGDLSDSMPIVEPSISQPAGEPAVSPPQWEPEAGQDATTRAFSELPGPPAQAPEGGGTESVSVGEAAGEAVGEAAGEAVGEAAGEAVGEAGTSAQGGAEGDGAESSGESAGELPADPRPADPRPADPRPADPRPADPRPGGQASDSDNGVDRQPGGVALAGRLAPAARPSPSPAASANTQLEIFYENRLKLAYFSVWIDGRKAFTKRLQAKLLKRFWGSDHRWTIPVAAGKHSVEVHVSGLAKQRFEAQEKDWHVFSVADPQRLTVKLRPDSRQLEFRWEDR